MERDESNSQPTLLLLPSFACFDFGVAMLHAAIALGLLFVGSAQGAAVVVQTKYEPVSGATSLEGVASCALRSAATCSASLDNPNPTPALGHPPRRHRPAVALPSAEPRWIGQLGQVWAWVVVERVRASLHAHRKGDSRIQCWLNYLG